MKKFIAILKDTPDYDFIVTSVSESNFQEFNSLEQAQVFVQNYYNDYSNDDITLVEVSELQLDLLDCVLCYFSDDDALELLNNHLKNISEFKLNQLSLAFDKISSLHPSHLEKGDVVFIDDFFKEIGFKQGGGFTRVYKNAISDYEYFAKRAEFANSLNGE